MDASALFELSYGLYILGVMDGSRPTGCVVNTVFQVTAEPMVVAVSISHDNFTNECLKKTGKLGVSVLAETADMSLFRDFGFRSGRDHDKFAGHAFELTQTGVPVLYEHTTAYLAGEVVGSYELDTHTIYFVKVTEAEKLFGKPMTYAYYHAVVKGRAPVNAPTYQQEQPVGDGASSSVQKKWVCTVCGYVYEGEIPFEQLPDDWTCPICGVGKDKFVLK